MTKVVWGDTGTRFFETGVDRGVLYVGIQDGVPWNGLTSISESPSGGEARPYYIDGAKFLNISGKEEFEATLEAFSCPAEFGVCDGTVSMQNGLFATQQPRRQFGLSYRTLVGNDTLSTAYGYKIHIVYNALASPPQRSYTSTNESPDPTTLSWGLTTLPPAMTGLKPTAHFVIDSRFTPAAKLLAVEAILYGDESTDARLPSVSELIALFAA